MTDIRGLHRPTLLMALFNEAKQADAAGPLPCRADMTYKHAQNIAKQGLAFRILNGRRLGIDISGDKMDTADYNNYNGAGLAEAVIHNMKELQRGVLQSDTEKGSFRDTVAAERKRARTCCMPLFV